MAREAAPLLDRFRRPLFPGVKVEFHARLPVVYTVAAITASVDPRAPAGVYKVTLTATVDFTAMAGVPIEELTAVVFPPVVDADRKPDAPPGQTDDSPAGLAEYIPPGEEKQESER